MKLRDRLVLWTMKALVPKGLLEQSELLTLRVDSGQSSPQDPKLVLRFETLSGQLLLSVVIEPDQMQEILDGLREWAHAYRYSVPTEVPRMEVRFDLPDDVDWDKARAAIRKTLGKAAGR